MPRTTRPPRIKRLPRTDVGWFVGAGAVAVLLALALIAYVILYGPRL